MQKSSILVAAVAAALLWVAVSAQQEMLPKPGPGSGVTNVTGTVSIANTPSVNVANTPTVRQDGEWRVAIQNTPAVRVTEVPSPGFLRTGARYEITWVDGTTEMVTISSIATNGWIEVERSRRWINLTSARSIREDR
jgi:hypothetical protein